MHTAPTAPRPAFPRAKGVPIAGGLFHYLKDQLGYLESAARQGDFVEVQFFNRRAIMVSNPSAIDQILVKNAAAFQKDSFLRALKKVLGEGLLTSEGDFWKRQRRLIQPAFHREQIAGYAQIMTRHTARFVEGLRDGAVVDVEQMMMKLTAEIVTECLFGTTAGDLGEVADCLGIVMARAANPLYFMVPALGELPLPKNRRYRDVAKRLDRIVRNIIEERRQAAAKGEDLTKAKDLLAMLLTAEDDDRTHMTDQQVRDEVLILFLAGHETTALAMSWALHELSEHPEIAAKLGEELDRVLGGRLPTFEDLPKLEYTAQVVNETLRLHPPAWHMGREAVADTEVDGMLFKKGSWVWVVPYTIHRDPRFFPEPLAFRPERWAGGFAKTLPKFAYLPFGGGPRVCIGNQFALMEGALLLATIAQKFTLKTVAGQVVEAEPSITLRLKHGLSMTAHARAVAAPTAATSQG